MTITYPSRNVVQSTQTTSFSRPGKPANNAFIESFNGTLRKEFLNLNWFRSIDEARETVEAWRMDYNESRLHLVLNDITPTEFSLRNGILP